MDIEKKESEINAIPTVLDYAKEKLDITKKMISEDKGLDYNHSSFLNGLLNAYDDIVFALENDVVKYLK